MYGLRSSTVGLIGSAIFGILIMSLFGGATPSFNTISIPASILFILVIVINAVFKKVHPIAVIALGAVAGIVLKLSS